MSYQSRHRIADQPVVFVTPASSQPPLKHRLAMTFKRWRERSLARRQLAAMDARSLPTREFPRCCLNQANRSGSLGRCAGASSVSFNAPFRGTLANAQRLSRAKRAPTSGGPACGVLR